ncbi:zinc ribbon domain-containing protein [Virgibacillus phasianinus]|uniref:Zinc ribbon domain-containing protein n=1 Tax=Virgibacillus phasianinus TaxID=2017483 RepID=A0A220U6A8_9BACI|nr:zinc ribbon domain-containing protein [Virgibacillus phasianinus]
MFHCPYCGTKVRDNESYCIKCGKQLPEDVHNRLTKPARSKKIWFLPLIIFALLSLSIGFLHLFLENQTAQAKDLYSNAEKKASEGNYKKAKTLFEEALKQKENFPQASNAIEFMDIAMQVQNNLDNAAKYLAKQEYQKALQHIAETDSTLKNYNGSVVKKLINEIVLMKNTIKTDQLKNQLEEEPSIDQLKILLWEAESIESSEAEKITTNIRNQIINYTYSKASKQLNKLHFSDAEILVKDGLVYAPDSKKLNSLQTAIDNERVAFETAQQRRIESAISKAEEERKQNKNDAVKLESVKLQENKQDKLVVKGKVKSVATIPINTILVEYDLLTKNGDKFKANEVYVFPDTLYPNETGEFEFTHFDITGKAKELKVKVSKIKWYTE